MNDLKEQIVAIVGASSGIGRATAKAAALRGASVILLSRSPTKLQDAISAISGTARSIALDMTDRAAVDATFLSIGPIDHLVLTAVADELARRAPITALSDEQVEGSFDKLRGFVNIVRAAVPLMSERASITLMTGASAAKPGRTGFSILAAESAGIVSFGKALALELAPTRVNVVMAGVVDTPIHRDQRDQIKSWAESDLPAHRFGQPEDIADAILFLMCNPYMTGHTLVIDGGLTAL
jgi:NAD(P)-dependent dehydrogenase (short-subunit alcohol dehydrogenase family)